MRQEYSTHIANGGITAVQFRHQTSRQMQDRMLYGSFFPQKVGTYQRRLFVYQMKCKSDKTPG